MTRLATALVSLLVLVTVACAPSRPAQLPVAEAGTLRQTRSGPVLGSETRQGNHAWLGIPFAAPPLGPLRWRAPQAVEPWPNVREALRIGAACPQFASILGSDDPGGSGSIEGDEDCLTLNVYAPALPRRALPARPGRGLPVMVWIHGGGNSVGHGGFYKPGALAASQGVVVVTVNYRLGVLGWFRHPALANGRHDPLDASGNYALLDLIQALRWVQDNIPGFGGDPEKVTVFGESAGGQNVLALLASPLSEGLFQRAISQSAVLDGASVSEAENFVDDATAPGHAFSSREVLLRLLVQDGSAANRAAAKTRAEGMEGLQIAHYLRGQSARDLLALFADKTLLGMYSQPQLIRDGAVLPELSLTACLGRPGCFHQVPVMLGTNRDESKLFQFWDPQQVDRLFGVIPSMRQPEEYALRAEYLSKAWKAEAADDLAAGMVAAGWPQVFVYRFDWDEEPSEGVDLGAMLGAGHGLEIPFVHGHWSLGKGTEMIYSADTLPSRQVLSAQMMSYWSAFASDGDPGTGRGHDLPCWRPWQAEGAASPGYMLLDTPTDGGLRRSTEIVTREGLRAALKQDPRLAENDLRCRVRQDLELWFGQGGRVDLDATCP